MRPLTSAVPPCGGGGGRRPTAPPAGCSRLSAVAAAVTAAAATESGNPPALLVFCKTPPHSSSVRAGICLVGKFSGVNKNNCVRANTLAYNLAGSQQSTNQSIFCASFGTVQVAKTPSKDNTLYRKCATGGVVAEATRSAATMGCRQAATMGTEERAVKRKHPRAPVSSRPLQATASRRCPQSTGDFLPLSWVGDCSPAAGTLLCGCGGGTVLCLRGAVTRGGSGAGAGRLWSLRQKLDSPRQADRRLGQSNAQKRLFDRPGLSTFWRNDNREGCALVIGWRAPIAGDVNVRARMSQCTGRKGACCLVTRVIKLWNSAQSRGTPKNAIPACLPVVLCVTGKNK